jgi:hypothetical protein
MDWAAARALLNAGSSMEARIAMMAMTTSNSMSVKVFFIFHSFLLLINDLPS